MNDPDYKKMAMEAELRYIEALVEHQRLSKYIPFALAVGYVALGLCVIRFIVILSSLNMFLNTVILFIAAVILGISVYKKFQVIKYEHERKERNQQRFVRMLEKYDVSLE